MTKHLPARTPHQGWQGWDDYAAFYDWENARTLGRRDVSFWRRLATAVRAPVLELGCGTGRLLVPIARTARRVVGIDRSAPMLGRARARIRRLPRAWRPQIVRGDVRRVPFRPQTFGAVIAAYGLIQSLLNDRDLDDALAEMTRVLRPGGVVGLDLVPDLPAWKSYHRRVRFRGRSPGGGRFTLVETVRQDSDQGLTTFEEEFIERRGRRATRREFSLTFRTVPLTDVVQRLNRLGLRVELVCGDYRGGPLTPTSDTWLIVARKV